MTLLSVLFYLLIIWILLGQRISSKSLDNLECASIHLSDNKTILKIFNNEIIDQEKFEVIRAGKLENAKFFVREYPEDQKKCLLEICGYNSQNPDSPYYYGNCESYNGSSNAKPIIASSNIYKNDYDLSSLSCSCTNPSRTCAFKSCYEKSTKKVWKGDECAILFQEKNCATCYFPSTNLLRNKWIYTLNAYQFRSMFIRPGCKVDTVIKNGLDRNEEWDTETINYLLGALILPSIGEAVYRDTDNFTCYCESNGNTISNDGTSTSKYVLTTNGTNETDLTTQATSPARNVNDTQNFRFSAVHYIILTGSAVFFVVILCYILKVSSVKIFRTTEKNEVNKVVVSDSPVSFVTNEDISENSTQQYNQETREMQLKSAIVDGFKQLIDSLIPSKDTEEHANSSDMMNCESFTCSNLLQLNQIYHPNYDVPRDSFWISKRNLENPLGSGQFGIVYKGTLKSRTDGFEKTVAVKKINWQPDSDDKMVQSFIHEVKTFLDIDNGNEYIVGYIGACYHSDGLYILTQYCEVGSLKRYLSHDFGPKIMSEQNNLQATGFTSVGDDYFATNQFAEKSLQTCQYKLSGKYLRHIFHWCEQIACGMEYLGRKGIIHVDLAIRNILLSSSKLVNGEEEYNIKICDFGLSKRCLDRENYAQSLLAGDFPFNSFAPECVCNKEKKISTYLDIWAYGCTIWEIFMLGDSLYPDVTERGIHKFLEVKKLLQEGYKHSKPPLTPDYVYNETMLKCWEFEPRNRPTFTELRNFFKEWRMECG